MAVDVLSLEESFRGGGGDANLFVSFSDVSGFKGG